MCLYSVFICVFYIHRRISYVFIVEWFIVARFNYYGKRLFYGIKQTARKSAIYILDRLYHYRRKYVKR